MKLVKINGETCYECKFGVDKNEFRQLFIAEFDLWKDNNPKEYREIFQNKVNDD